MKSRFSKIRNKLKGYKNKLKSYIKQLQEKTELPDSKIERGALGMITVLSIFGISWLGCKLPAVAKDVVPKNTPQPGSAPGTCNQPPSAKPAGELFNEGLSGAAGVVCGMAVSSGSYIVGGLCGFLVVIGILRVRGE
nr:hypothetical protein [Cylindrotheca closterium]